MSQTTLHLLTQSPSRWQQCIDKNTPFLMQQDTLVLLGDACAGLSLSHAALIAGIQQTHQLSLCVLQTDIDTFQVNSQTLPTKCDVITHEHLLKLCQTHARVITW